MMSREEYIWSIVTVEIYTHEKREHDILTLIYSGFYEMSRYTHDLS